MNVVRSAGGSGNKKNYKLENENPSVIHRTCRPSQSINELMKKTRFSKEEIQHLYRTFKQDNPSGEVTKSRFAAIIGTLFPSGECFRYSTFVFQNIDRTNSGYIRFEDFILTLSILIHGTLEERLSWIFDLYDLNKDGTLTRAEFLQFVTSVFQLIIPIRKLNFSSMTNLIEERTDELFQAWDKNGNGFLYKRDFLQCCLQNEMITSSMEALKANICL